MRYAVVLTSMLVAGCAPTQSTNTYVTGAPDISTQSCNSPSNPQCKFLNTPVQFSKKVIELPGRDFPFSLTVESLSFIDAKNKKWVAPVGTLTDGASIPTMFVGIMGHPRSKEFLNAAVVHDAFCATGNEDGAYYHTATWQAVHRMFYDAIRVSGVPGPKAKTMYAALYLGGPRWSGSRSPRRTAKSLSAPLNTTEYGSTISSANIGNLNKPMIERLLTTVASSSGLRGQQGNKSLRSLHSAAKLRKSLKRAKAYIEANNPSIDKVETFLTNEEHGLSTRGSTKKAVRTITPDVESGGEGDAGGGGGGGHY